MSMYIDHGAICDLTNVIIPEDIAMTLSWGPKFVFPNENLDNTQLAPTLENMIHNKFQPPSERRPLRGHQ